MTNHLDLGCGDSPRNPFAATNLFGIDVVNLGIEKFPNFSYVQADLFVDAFPFENNFFDSISAFDFLEHVPRVGVPGAASSPPRSPLMHVMSEIHRCLRPNGLFIASTPAYPHPAAFQDPTHVNIMTIGTHDYFCGSEPYAWRYGFKGRFSCELAKWDAQKNAWHPETHPIRKWYRNTERRLFKGGLSHVTWMLRAVK